MGCTRGFSQGYGTIDTSFGAFHVYEDPTTIGDSRNVQEGYAVSGMIYSLSNVYSIQNHSDI